MYYNKEGKSIQIMEWAKLFEDREYQRVAKTLLKNGRLVSTVWLGLDHSFLSNKKEIFETMVFRSEKDLTDLDCERYSTLKEALAGHKKMVNKWKVK
jgi:hypothetical protein